MTNDEIGKDKFKSFLTQKRIDKYLFTKEFYNRLDCYYKFNDITVGVEIKNRSNKDECFPDYIMELGKFNAMKERICQNKIDTAQMIYFFGNTMYVFNYAMINRLYKQRIIIPILATLPNSTDNYTHNTQKQVFYLPKQYAYKYILKDNKWILVNTPKKSCK